MRTRAQISREIQAINFLIEKTRTRLEDTPRDWTLKSQLKEDLTVCKNLEKELKRTKMPSVQTQVILTLLCILASFAYVLEF